MLFNGEPACPFAQSSCSCPWSWGPKTADGRPR